MTREELKKLACGERLDGEKYSRQNVAHLCLERELSNETLRANLAQTQRWAEKAERRADLLAVETERLRAVVEKPGADFADLLAKSSVGGPRDPSVTDEDVAKVLRLADEIERRPRCGSCGKRCTEAVVEYRCACGDAVTMPLEALAPPKVPVPPVSTVAMAGSTGPVEPPAALWFTEADVALAHSQGRSLALGDVYDAIETKYQQANAGEGEHVWAHALMIVRRLASSPPAPSSGSSKDS